MKKGITVFLVLLLASCSFSDDRSNVEILFDCINEIDQDSSCDGKETKEKIELGVEEFVEEIGFAFHNEETTYNVHLEYSKGLSTVTLIVYVKTINADFTKIFYDSVLSLVEEVSAKVQDNELPHKFSITVDLKNETTFGHDTIRVVKRPVQSELLVSYYLEDITLKTIEEEQQLILTILTDSADYDTTISLNEIDFSIEDKYLRYDFIRLNLLNGDNTVKFAVKKDTRILQEYRDQEMLETLVNIFSEYDFIFTP